MKIRPIQSQDDAQLYQLIRNILEEEGLALPGTAYEDETLVELSTFYKQTKNAAYFVLVDEKEAHKVYGGVGIAPFSVGVAELQKFYLTKEARGQGWSRKLMDQAIDFAQKHYQKLYLESHTKLKAALKLYQDYGFEPLEHALLESEHSAMNVWLLKNLLLDCKKA
ncbi:GNAT family N-acetyltransferase [Lactococcus kimchii]|uniref:GNAT family N-acetyltransferase n=1 Tax=Lactococcus sp. S-13 TaxID=2507158 RepID=UPI001022C313|nr:GNAT family N-acetyltransferase [Lactococcus sp. S-13]RZI49100.1 N-acetyltransferase [Lactococcus sp. S-13]